MSVAFVYSLFWSLEKQGQGHAAQVVHMSFVPSLCPCAMCLVLLFASWIRGYKTKVFTSFAISNSLIGHCSCVEISPCFLTPRFCVSHPGLAGDRSVPEDVKG